MLIWFDKMVIFNIAYKCCWLMLAVGRQCVSTVTSRSRSEIMFFKVTVHFLVLKRLVLSGWLITMHCVLTKMRYWCVRVAVKGSDVLLSRVCWWLKKGWGPVDVFSTGCWQERQSATKLHQLPLMELHTFHPLLGLIWTVMLVWRKGNINRTISVL